ncbi:FtsK/SpoIIIE domain-containing protein [Clostridium pasteurianum]|uniref:FtsK/SpoIIIE domain-containing protein n=1 Tax=Clostridium pasteurianum TaxID=1501 RepID=UPI002260B235|nr:FtsK/SpoIIIE domain-containing protein [Clostridium pasteurianum]UZW13172.1 FtsK/SpoIIIE domain-containing protein [Clostridium pasteurianum]
MKNYVFNNVDSFEQKLNYSLAAVGSIIILYGFTASIVLCNVVTLLGGAIAYKYFSNNSFNKLVKNNLYNLIKTNGYYKLEEDKLIYRPEIYYTFTDKYLEIKIRLDGSNHRDDYLQLENLLEDLFVMECVSKEQINGFMIYKLDRTSTNRLSITEIKRLQGDFIPINSKLQWNFRKCPHALISGVTGKGKTYFLAYLIKSFLLLKADIKILDPKISDLSYLENLFKDCVASSPNHIAKILRETVEKMNSRYEQFKKLSSYRFGKDYKDYGYKPVVIIFDEMAAFMASVDKKLSKEVNDYMAEIVMKGRQAGIFMILTTQRPDADVIKTNIRDQLGLRIALGEMSKTAYSMIFGSDFNDLELNNNAPGNGYIFIDGITTKPVRFQSPYFEQDYNFVRDLIKTRRGH